MEFSKKNIKIILGIITFAIGLFAVSQNLTSVLGFLAGVVKIFAPVITGFCLAFILNILMNFFENKVFKGLGKSKKRVLNSLLRPFSLVSTIITMFGFIVLLMFIIIPQLEDSIMLLVEKVPVYYADFVSWIDSLVERFSLEVSTEMLHNPQIKIEDIVAMAEKIFTFESTGDILNTTMGVTSTVVSGFINLVLGFVIAVYILAEKEKIGEFVNRILNAVLPEKPYKHLCDVCSVASNSFANFITGQFTDALILAILTFIGMLIFGFPNAAVVSVIIGISALIPVVGPIVGEIIGCLLIFMESPLKALLFLVFVLILQAIDNNFIYPKIVGKSVGLPGILVLVAVILGGNIGGMLGVLLGVPIASAIYALVVDWLKNRQIEKEEVKVENTDEFENTDNSSVETVEE
ncbi:MAG: AI-2E family transporter [Clostridia bacterium]|nr:AI-2E family transporter [Clostridia bacterium]